MEFWFPFLFGFAPVIGLALFLNIGLGNDMDKSLMSK